MTETFNFQAEIQQVLDILVHSLYTEREIFLRELISNASDALSRIQFELLTNRDVLDPDAELAIEIKTDEEAGTITISDTGVGMTRDDLINNLGVIARSGAKAFIQAIQEAKNGGATDIIGQFGVGFYSVFMVADKVQVITRSHLPNESAYIWESTGAATFTIEPGQREVRGTDIVVYLKEDAKEFASEWKLKDIIRRHSDYITFPIYVGESEEATNKQQAIWRQDPKEITPEQYGDFYKMLTLDWNEPLHHIHMRADSPLQFYTLLFIPGGTDLGILSPRKEPGLKLYARKVLIQEYNKDLLPEYLQFVQGVVDSEDLPLNVSRESVQANRIMANLKKTITGKVLTELKRLAQKNRADYLKIYGQFGRFIKQGVAVSPTDRTDIEPLLYFTSTRSAAPDEFFSLDEYVEHMAENQSDIYYIMGEDFHSVSRSPHLDAFHQRGIEVLYFTDPVDPFMLMGLADYKGHTLRSVDEADLDLNEVGKAEDESPAHEPLAEDTFTVLRDHFAAVLGDRVRDVRQSKTLTGSPARLVSDEAGANRQMFRINRLLDRDYELPVKILELNPRHPLLHNLSGLLQGGTNPLVDVVVEQVFETALLQDGIHPDPSAMAARLNLLMQAATGTPAGELNYDAVRSAEPAQEPESEPDDSAE
ncbi:MAG: molecular chaperone HtpG [Anaerolineae bacterium]|nr:molecular chaperone HtpG [Anaerolineae bacterium]